MLVVADCCDATRPATLINKAPDYSGAMEILGSSSSSTDKALGPRFWFTKALIEELQSSQGSLTVADLFLRLFERSETDVLRTYTPCYLPLSGQVKPTIPLSYAEHCMLLF